ncbi:MAG: MBL fold metallo-hydrolase [Deltaproteobacteria bacterium]|nr:MBL fold metallo-hydrolase [Deltaproteobacteria bacterium]
MKVKFWGVRGSVPTPGPTTVRYGGNTTCIEVRASGTLIILDAGTGIRELGYTLTDQGTPLHISLLITHTHWDHINGFPFFPPAFVGENVIDVYGTPLKDRTLEQIFSSQMDYSFFPITQTQMDASLNFHDIKETTFLINDIQISTRYMNHPVLNLGYRISHKGKSIFFTGDHEPHYNIKRLQGTENDEDKLANIDAMVNKLNQSIVDFVQDVDLLICDATYTPEEYNSHVGWGHASTDQVLDLAVRAGVKKLVLTHHEPAHSDEKMDKIHSYALKKVRDMTKSPPLIITAMEKMVIEA